MGGLSSESLWLPSISGQTHVSLGNASNSVIMAIIRLNPHMLNICPSFLPQTFTQHLQGAGHLLRAGVELQAKEQAVSALLESPG